MQYLTFEFENEAEMRRVAQRLWDQHGVTGEMHMTRTPAGRWRLQVVSEKELRDVTLKQYEQYRAEVSGAGSD